VLLTPASRRWCAARLAAVTPWLALLFVVGVVPVTALLLQPVAEALGLQPDGDPAPLPHAVLPCRDRSSAEASRTRFFVAVTVAHLLAMLAQVGGIAHLFNLVAERVDEGGAARAAGARVLLAGRAPARWRRRVAGLDAAARVVLMARRPARSCCSRARQHGVAAGRHRAVRLTVGNLLMLHPLLLAERFGVRDYARIYSRSQFAATFGVAAGPGRRRGAARRARRVRRGVLARGAGVGAGRRRAHVSGPHRRP
jgi:hypothetical protein